MPVRTFVALARRVLDWLANEPIVTHLGPVGFAAAVVSLAGALGWISPDTASALAAFLVAVGGPVGYRAARARTVGPVTASQMIELPGTDPTKAAD